MIDYKDLERYAPPALSKEERDEWFASHDFDVTALAMVGAGLAEHRLGQLADGDTLGEKQLVSLIASAVLFGFELAVRIERDEPAYLGGGEG